MSKFHVGHIHIILFLVKHWKNYYYFYEKLFFRPIIVNMLPKSLHKILDGYILSFFHFLLPSSDNIARQIYLEKERYG